MDRSQVLARRRSPVLRPHLAVFRNEKHAPVFDSLRKPSSWLAHPAQIKTAIISGILFVRDGGIELPTTVWKTVVLPLN